MKTSFLLLAALAGLGCTPGQGPVHIRGVLPASAEDCTPVDGMGVAYFEFIDVAGDPEVYLFLELGGLEDFSATTTQPQILVNGRSISSPGSRERVQIQSAVLTYRSVPSISGINDRLRDEVPLFVPLDETISNPRIAVPLFGRQAREKFRALPGDNAAEYQFTTSIELRGILDPSQAPIRTPPVLMPSRLFKTEVRCPNQADSRLAKRRNNDLYCSYKGLAERYTDADCCSLPQPTDVDKRVGCDRVAQ